MHIFGLEKLSLVDYQSYACAVVFSGGCNFRCPFCHNSGLVNREVEELKYSEVMDYLIKRYGLLEAVVVSGGEPTLEPDLLEFLSELKKIGYKVKLDTNGTNPKMLKEAIEKKLVDYVAMDIKNSIIKYPITTGLKHLDTDLILESIEILKQNKVDYEFRTTIVDEYHELEDMKQIGELLKGSKRLYLQRYVDSDTCITPGLTSVSKKEAQEWVEELRTYIEEVSLRGYI